MTDDQVIVRVGNGPAAQVGAVQLERGVRGSRTDAALELGEHVGAGVDGGDLEGWLALDQGCRETAVAIAEHERALRIRDPWVGEEAASSARQRRSEAEPFEGRVEAGKAAELRGQHQCPMLATNHPTRGVSSATSAKMRNASTERRSRPRSSAARSTNAQER